ncbi:hypothetical protein SAMD00019534_095250 [Acytostelium subglobosum LB1]|uniref:hypothetical protein n=1 Tax=Acytostelium subglobosum LB1 TaxID=1410327 RepID=UPI000644BDF5|nr:hypothetical protein SAMD00019534_095250 [Acytostelium subglobosum LB1]GAM26350.1 hypothetical protein SAMD00019534_095250 [Acytostelium subglobosum LB1]|eukprot:XP_012750904.1 hypothetical protein SAMD00019534_095250 [Acytostelium subglobosum LB1]
MSTSPSVQVIPVVANGSLPTTGGLQTSPPDTTTIVKNKPDVVVEHSSAATPTLSSSSSSSSPPASTTASSSSPLSSITPSTSGSFSSRITTVYIEEIQARNINEKDLFVKFKVDRKKFKTRTQKRTSSPLWNEKYTLSTPSKVDEIQFTLYSQNLLGNNIKVGTVKYSLHGKNGASTTTTDINKQQQSADTTEISSSTSSFTSSSSTTFMTVSSDTVSESSTPIVESININHWLPLERRIGPSPAAPPELKVRMVVKIRDISLLNDTDTNSSTSVDDHPTQLVPPSRYHHHHSRHNHDGSIKDPKEMSLIGKGGSHIKKLTKRITSKIDKGGNSSSHAGEQRKNDERMAIIEEQVAKERVKELEKEAIDKEKERAREKLRQREDEELQKQLEKERQEERRKAKEAKMRKEREKRMRPTRPIDYFFVVGCSSKLEPIDQRYDMSSKLTDPMEICYKGELLDTYPPKDEEILPSHIWMYCFPKGVSLSTEELPPSFFPFVLTNEVGTRFYGSCLMFYEPLSEELSTEVKKRRHAYQSAQQQSTPDNSSDNEDDEATAGSNDRSKRASTPLPSAGQQPLSTPTSPVQLSSNNTTSPQSSSAVPTGLVPSQQQMYTPKCICFLSHYPFYSFFRVCLNDLYQKVFFMSAPLPIERYILNMVHDVPLPVQGVSTVNYTINKTVISLKRPPECLLPMSDLPFSLLFKCLDIKNVLMLLKCILLEEKIVFISTHYSLLTYVAEIFSALLHPFVWPHVYVPVLPELLLEYVYSPFPFIMGVHKSMSNYILNEENLLSEIVIADLDNNMVLIPQGQDRLHQASLPERETAQLTYQLRKVTQFELQCSDMPNYDLNSMSPIQSSINTDLGGGGSSSSNNNRRFTNNHHNQHHRHHYNPAPTPPASTIVDEHIRLSFLQFFCSIMVDYRSHLKYLRVFPKPITLFNKLQFVRTRATSASELFYTSFVETQSFSYFLDQHSWPKKNVFDYLIETQRFKRPVEELCVLNNTAIPQALGVQEPAKYSVVNAPAPSSLRTAPTTIREYSRFPPLKADLMVTTSSSSGGQDHVVSTASLVSMDIYSTSIAMAESGPANPSDDTLLPLAIVEEQHKSFDTIIQQFLSKISGDVPPESSDTQQLLELLKFESGRQLFGYLLLKHQRNNADENVPSKARLSDAMFYCLGDMLKAALREANLHSDFASTRMFLEASFIYHRIQKVSNEHVSERLRNQDIWQNYKFWEQFFYDSIEQRCRMLYGNIIREMLKWHSYAGDKQDKIKNDEREMEFSLLSKLAYYMIHLGTQPDLMRRFVNKMCSTINFDNDRTEIMMQVVSNITRAREMYDMDNLENDSTSVTMDGNKHVDKDLHQFTKDTYISIGGRNSTKANEGRELLTHLIDEKSNNIVALRSLSRIMNLKSAWAEKRSKTSAKIDYRDISENRGDYVVKTFNGHTEGVLCLALTAQGHRENNVLVTGSADSTLRVWDVTSTNCLGILEDHGGWVNCVELVSDSKIFSASYDKTLKLWDLNKCTKVKSFRGHKGSVSCLKNIDNHQTISGSYDNTLFIWDDRSTKPAGTLLGHQQPIMSVLSDGYRIISGSRDTNIRVWDLRTMTTFKILSGHTDWVKCLQYDNADVLLSGCCDGKVKVWSLESGECLRTLQGHSGSINSLLHHKKGDVNKFVTASADSTIQVWDSNNGVESATLTGHNDEVMGVENFINNLVVSGSFDGTVKLWDVDTGKSHRTIHNHTNRISTLKTYESIIATASWDKTAKACIFGLDFRI